jgi:hypothetical protein
MRALSWGPIADAGTWMTCDELAKARGIACIGAVRLVQREQWRCRYSHKSQVIWRDLCEAWDSPHQVAHF